MLQVTAHRLLMVGTILTASWNGALSLATEKPPKEATPGQPPSATPKPSAEEAIRQALKKNVSLWYYEVPLSDIAWDLESKLGVPVRLDTAALKESGADKDTAVTFAIAKVSARAAISHVLRQVDLTTVIEDEALWITTRENAYNKLLTKVYDIADLVRSRNGAADEQPDFGPLIDVISNTIQKNTWASNGGVGTISGFCAAGIQVLVVSQTEDAHCELKDLLEQLRSIRAARAGGNKTPSQEVTKPREVSTQQPVAVESRPGSQISAAERAIRLALQQPLTLRIKAVPLSTAIQQLAKAAAVPIIIDKETIAIRNLASASVTLDAAGRTFRSVLNEFARSLHLAWTYRGETLLLLPVSEEEDGPHLVSRVYDLADLPAYRNRHGEGIPDYDHIKDTITETINSRSWTDNGGTASIDQYDKAGIHGIVVSQTWRTHLEIEDLLAKLREARGHPFTSDDIKRLPLAPTQPKRPEVVAAEAPPRPLQADPRRDAVVAANNQFALDLHKQLQGDNRIFSPSSISTAMAMIYAGARGKTADEIAKGLHFSLRQEDVAPGYQSLLATLPGANRAGCTLTSANRLWGRQGYGFLQPFLATTRERFGAELVEADFTQPAPLCDLINAWADKQTAGKIKQVIDPSLIKPDLRFIVTNAVYFKGLWAEPFKKEGTKTAPFFAAGGQVDVPLMHRLTRCRYSSFDNVKVLEKPYRGGEIAMMVLLPENEPNSLDDLEKSLSAKKLDQWAADLEMKEVDIFLPKFTLETTMRLNQPLTTLGMAEVFDQKRADLSGINGGKEPLWLDWILQRAYVNVDEEGTEATAVTGLGGGGMGMPEPKIKVFRADHPFLFLIRDTRTGCILFMGRLAKPEK